MEKIKDFERYLISESGDIINTSTGRVLKSSSNQKGYRHVQLSNNGMSRTISVHREVYKAYKGFISSDLEINHIDGNKSNNHISNLETVTRKENMIKAVETGLVKSGADCKLSVSVTQIDVMTNEPLKVFGSIRCAVKDTGIAGSAISSVCSGRRKTAGGFKWSKTN